MPADVPNVTTALTKDSPMPTQLVRIVVQLLLAGPVLLLLPMSLVVSGAALFSFAGGDRSGTVMALFVFLATLAFAALLASIVMPVAAICQRRWLLWSVRISLCLGILMASVLLFNNAWRDLEMSDALLYAWTGLGSLAVAAWNLYRMQVHVSEVAPPVQADV
ncbi:MAG: hypothetical protein JNM76_12675 [Betaproteobacteria bacterium]|nr:hypothetical protein [Betaproteobacteria bacterium]